VDAASKPHLIANCPASNASAHIVLRPRFAGAKPAAFPGFIKPCLATLRGAVPNGGAYVHELKLDGYRIQAHLHASGEWILTFAVITTDANELVAGIHDRMPLILAPGDYTRWLGDEPDPRDLMRPFPTGPMRMWPISTRVNKPENDDPSIVEPVELHAA
jgi:hypothetical protein